MRVGVECGVVGNVKIESISKYWSMVIASVDGFSLITILSCLI